MVCRLVVFVVLIGKCVVWCLFGVLIYLRVVRLIFGVVVFRFIFICSGVFGFGVSGVVWVMWWVGGVVKWMLVVEIVVLGLVKWV